MDIGAGMAIGIPGAGLIFAGAQIIMTKMKIKEPNLNGKYVRNDLCKEKMDNIKDRLDSIDGKLDMLLESKIFKKR